MSEVKEKSPEILTAGDRILLKVELLPGETTYVSWKKVTDASPPPNPNPNLAQVS